MHSVYQLDKAGRQNDADLLPSAAIRALQTLVDIPECPMQLVAVPQTTPAAAQRHWRHSALVSGHQHTMDSHHSLIHAPTPDSAPRLSQQEHGTCGSAGGPRLLHSTQ